MLGFPTRQFLQRRIGRFFSTAAVIAAVAGCAGTSPTGALVEDDLTKRVAARADALEHNKTGEGANWHNPETGSRGTVVPTRTYKSSYGEDCRDFQETVTAGDATDVLNGAACRNRSGGWKIVRGPYRRSHGAYGPYDPYGAYGYRHWYFDYWGRPYFRYGTYFGGW